MSSPAFRVIDGGRSEMDAADSPDVRHPTTDAPLPTPYWWRWIVIQSLRHGKWFLPLWPSLVILRVLRSWSIKRALQAMRPELGYPVDDHTLGPMFIRVEEERRQDPTFWAACEEALRIGRITIFGRLPVILDREIKDRGQKTFLNHFGWTVSRKLPDPLPWAITP